MRGTPSHTNLVEAETGSNPDTFGSWVSDLNHSGGGGGLWVRDPGREKQSSGPETPSRPAAPVCLNGSVALSLSEGAVLVYGESPAQHSWLKFFNVWNIYSVLPRHPGLPFALLSIILQVMSPQAGIFPKENSTTNLAFLISRLQITASPHLTCLLLMSSLDS